MRELVYYVAVSLDGFIAGPNGEYDAFLFEGDHAEAIIAELPETLPGHVRRMIGITAPNVRFDTVLQGWGSYRVALDAGIDSPYAHLHQIVASRSAHSMPDDVALTSDPVATVRDLKAQSGRDIWLCGGGEIAGSLVHEIDRLILKRNPIVLGAGIPLFGRTRVENRRLDLVGARPFESGVVFEEYVRHRT